MTDVPDRAPGREFDLRDLPQQDELGTEGEWFLPAPTGEDSAELIVRGTFLGMGSSRHLTHKFHSGAHADRGGRCGACRWFETRVFRLSGDRGYLLYHVGVTTVPGESQRVSSDVARSPEEVLEVYTRRRDGEVYMTAPSARALAQAAGYDADLRDAYRDRAVL